MSGGFFSHEAPTAAVSLLILSPSLGETDLKHMDTKMKLALSLAAGAGGLAAAILIQRRFRRESCLKSLQEALPGQAAGMKSVATVDETFMLVGDVGGCCLPSTHQRIHVQRVTFSSLCFIRPCVHI